MRKLLIAPLALLASACATAPTPEFATSAEAIAAAEAATKQAAEVNNEWRDTGALIKQAKEAAAAKDDAKAMSLAVQALHQSRNAIKQQAEQQDAASSN